ncbi:MAG: DUF998 domain-containing protein [Clostridia bacterium]|jgi:hypothetical protein|nr:DUF998 domain-containing protein [Clostridia bacterium]
MDSLRMVTRYLILVGVVSPLLYFGASFIGGAANQGYSHIKDSVSDLLIKGSPKLPTLDTMMIISFVFIALSCAAMLITHAPSLKGATKAGIIVVGLSGVFSLFSSIIFRLDPHSSGMTVNTSMHITFVALAAIATIVGGMLIGFTMFSVGGWSGFRIYTVITFAFMLVGAAISPVIVANNVPVVGLVERISIIAYNQWFVVVAIKFFILKDGWVYGLAP